MEGRNLQFIEFWRLLIARLAPDRFILTLLMKTYRLAPKFMVYDTLLYICGPKYVKIDPEMQAICIFCTF